MDRVAAWTEAKQILGWSPKMCIEIGLKKNHEWCSIYLEKNNIIEKIKKD